MNIRSCVAAEAILVAGRLNVPTVARRRGRRLALVAAARPRLERLFTKWADAMSDNPKSSE